MEDLLVWASAEPSLGAVEEFSDCATHALWAVAEHIDASLGGV